MPQQQRLIRPEVKRVAPDRRGLLTLVRDVEQGLSGNSQAARKKRGRGATGNGRKRSRRPGDQRETEPKHEDRPLGRAVADAYEFINRYMERGYEAARHYRHTIQWEDEMRYNRDDECEYPGAWSPMSAMFSPLVQMTRMWADTVSAFVPGSGRMGSRWANDLHCSCGCGERKGFCRGRRRYEYECSCGCGAANDSDCRGHSRRYGSRYHHGCSCGCGASSDSDCHKHRRRRHGGDIVVRVTGGDDIYSDVQIETDSTADKYELTFDKLEHEDEKIKNKLVVTSQFSQGRTFVTVAVDKNDPPGEYGGAIRCSKRECGWLTVSLYKK